MSFFFWTILFLIFYTYFGYPLLIYGLARLWPRPVKKAPLEPAITFILSVWNEEDVIEAKVKNLLSLDYPEDKTEILIGTDGCTDRTEEILRRYESERLRIVSYAGRRGKIGIINDLVREAKGEILVFTDARQAFARNALRELTANFSDPAVGCVSGELVFSTKEGGTAKGINLYWTYEKFIRKQESAVHSMLGATGAIYAMKKSLYVPIKENLVLDDVWLPMHVVFKGYRAVFDESALAYDEVADSPREETRRKIRTLSGNFQLLFALPDVLNPFMCAVAFQMASHKLLRLLGPFMMAALFLLNLWLLPSLFFKVLFGLQVLFYLMAVIGGLARHQKYGMLKILSNICYAPYVFCLLNWASFLGFIRFMTNTQDVTWEKARE